MILSSICCYVYMCVSDLDDKSFSIIRDNKLNHDPQYTIELES